MKKSFRKNEKGQAIVEFAFILPVLLLILFGVIEMGRIGYTYVSVNNAVRVGARTASVGGSDLEINTAIANAVTFDNSKLIINIEPSESLRKSGQEVLVKVSYPVQLIIPIIENVVSNPVIVKASLKMRIE